MSQHRIGEAREEHARGEEERADHYHPLSAEEVGGDSGERHHAAVGEQEDRARKAELRVGRAMRGEVALDLRQRGVEHLPRPVHEKIGDRQQSQHDPLVPSVVILGHFIPFQPLNFSTSQLLNFSALKNLPLLCAWARWAGVPKARGT